jgi:signal transduction histidine kinase
MKNRTLLKENSDLQIILVAALFYASACLGYFLSFENTTILPIWPPSGIGLALILLLGRKCWPGLTIGSLLASIMAFWNNPGLPIPAIIVISTAIAVSTTLEVLLGNFLIRRFIQDAYAFKNAKHTFRFLFIAGSICALGALINTVALFVYNVVDMDQWVRVGISFWIGDLVGVLLFTPFILSFISKKQVTFSRDKIFETLVLAICAALIFLVLQIDYFHLTFERALPFLLLPVLLWMAFRFDLLVAMSAVLVVSLMSIYFTILGDGPFHLGDPYHSIILLQIFIVVMSISTIVLSATVQEREHAQRQLLQFNETLETKINERTASLHEEIRIRKEAEEKLQRSNAELSKRNTELDNFVYSVSHDLRAPIASVLGLINLAKKDDVGMKDLYLDMMHKSAQQQDHFIREILDQSRNSRLEVKREEIEFQSMIDDTFNQLKFATTNGQAVKKIVNIKQNKPFFSDRWRFKVMLNNIISNSIRYRNGKEPEIHVNVEVSDDFALVEIQDNGKGIAREHLKKVCTMFYRATDDGAGSGLGLYIVKETVDKLNGTLNIDSEEGKGTVVKFQIPEVMN